MKLFSFSSVKQKSLAQTRTTTCFLVLQKPSCIQAGSKEIVLGSVWAWLKYGLFSQLEKHYTIFQCTGQLFLFALKQFLENAPILLVSIFQNALQSVCIEQQLQSYLICWCIPMHVSHFRSPCNYYFTDFSSPIPLVVKESTYMHIRRYLYLCTHHIYDTYKYSFSCTCIQTHTYCECIPIPYLISRAIYLLIVQILCCWQFEWNILPKIRSQWQSHKTLLFWSPEGRKEKR